MNLHLTYVIISSIIGGIITYEISKNILTGIMGFGIITALWATADYIKTRKMLKAEEG